MLPVRKVASETQLLRGMLRWAIMGVSKLTRLTERRRFRQQLLTGLEYEDSVLEEDVETKLQTIWALPGKTRTG